MNIALATMKANRLTQAHMARRKSKSEQAYSKAISNCTDDIREIICHANLDEVLSFIALLMQYDLERYTDDLQIKKNVQKPVKKLTSIRIDADVLA